MTLLLLLLLLLLFIIIIIIIIICIIMAVQPFLGFGCFFQFLYPIHSRFQL
jgi:hypothetical protein